MATTRYSNKYVSCSLCHNDPNILPSTAVNYPKYGSTDVDMVYNSTVQEYFEVNPNNPSGCSVGTSTCVYTVLYIGQIDLAPINPSTGQPVIGGYFLIHEACCRNGGANGIDNIQDPGLAGMAFYAYIPPYGYENASPIFTDNPVPFICSGDTTTFLNTANDPDGDELLLVLQLPLTAITLGVGEDQIMLTRQEQVLVREIV